MQLENGNERGAQCSMLSQKKSYATIPVPTQSRKVPSSIEIFSRIASDPTHPWLRSSRANKGPLPEWER